jgi:hydrogenase expression/formation protein HypC
MCLGVPGQIVEVTDAARKLALVNVAGVRRVINVACVARDASELERCVGSWVLVHVGFAMSRIDAAEAQKTLDLLAALGEAQAELAALEGAAPDSAAPARSEASAPMRSAAALPMRRAGAELGSRGEPA